ncbi:hypothetical protein SJ05684_c17180 [Sinorhizobium sojae CCBAU 05684]|uniref:Uncharacterized protein n=1 Tax=Sinorhizobium sojae CCBAU 05684 TaxID=716928 RepID=A0A249PB32_9HYPH|nr:hypothetical protein SJ05684_c17180 [Sinorhizobium sojae CCBAU 05684]
MTRGAAVSRSATIDAAPVERGAIARIRPILVATNPQYFIGGF